MSLGNFWQRKSRRQPELNGAVVAEAEGVSQLTIRHLVKTDLPQLEWGGEYTHFRRLYAQAYVRATENKAVLWVAELAGEGIIGQVFVQLTPRREELLSRNSKSYLYSFRVHPSYRNRGIGTRLMDVAEEDLARRGVGIATLNVGQDNPAARRLYERRGYRVVGAEPGVWQYVDHDGFVRTIDEPAWRMEKKLLAIEKIP